MDEQDIIRLIQKQEEQTITATEYQQLKKWFDESADNQKTYRDYCVIYQGLKIEADKQRFERSNHGKTKSARIQKRNVFSTDKNEM